MSGKSKVLRYLAMGTVGFVAVFALAILLFFVTPHNWKDIVESDIARLEQFCRNRFAEFAKVKYQLADQPVICRVTWSDFDFGAAHYNLTVYESVEILVQGPTIAYLENRAYYDDPQRIWVSLFDGAGRQINGDEIRNGIGAN